MTLSPQLRTYALRGVMFLAVLLILDRIIGSVLEHGLRRYYGLERPAEIFIIGHSRAVLGIDEVRLGEALGLRVAKYAVQGATTADRAAMVRHALSLHPGARAVLYDVEAASFADDVLSEGSYRLFYPFIADAVMRDHLRAHAASPLEFAIRHYVWTARWEETTFALAWRGGFNRRENLKPGPLDRARLDGKIRAGRIRPARLEPANRRAFLELAEELRAAGVLLILVDMPTVDTVNALHGAAGDDIRRHFTALAAASPSVRYLDFHTAFTARDDLFHDDIHLSAPGKDAFTALLATSLRPLLSPSP